MSKKLHLICNAHLDPVWQWEWEEGAAEALSTFRIAADFCQEYDHFVFCHNEALLYQWIEEYDSELFEKIKMLVQQGKWHIMGGWQLQPDCNMPSGEAFVRQIYAGRNYFLEKFGVVPTVAVNVDPFGHTRGLVQIMSKTGYTGYLFMRPGEGERFIKLPADEFKWVGYDGSEVTAVRILGFYNSPKGRAAEKIREYVEYCKEDDFFLCLWGVGNHGGGPSKKDLEDIQQLTREMEKKDVTLVHSTPEQYIQEVNEKHTLPVFEKSLNSWGVGCYTSQVRIKQKYRQAENIYFLTEMMCAHAASAGLIEYPAEDFAQAIYDILTVQFHDILPGSSIQPAEEMGIRVLDHAIEILSRLKARAFFALSAGQKKAQEDKIPIVAYNPYPYAISGDFTCEFMLWDQMLKQEFWMPKVYDANGKLLPTQAEKENSNIPIEWRKRVAFHATLAPMTMNRFDCGFDVLDEKPAYTLLHNDTHYIFERGGKHIEINRNTGCVDTFRVDGTEYMQQNAFELQVYQDDFDPWEMRNTAWKEKIGKFSLLTPEQGKEFCCIDEPIAPVHVIESGQVRTVVEVLLGYNGSRAVVKYILSDHEEGVKTDIRIQWSEKQKLVKLCIPAAFQTEDCIGEHAYGRESLKTGQEENVSQKYIAVCGEDKAILAVNNGVYGSSFDETAGELKITLLRSPGYTAHPTEDRKVMRQDRYSPYIDQGERDFSFLFTAGKRQDILEKAPRLAQAFNMQPMLLSFYPTGNGNLPASPIRLTDHIIQITAFKKASHGKGYILRLFNPTEEKRETNLQFDSAQMHICFTPFEIKTIRYADGQLKETDLLENLLDK